MVNKFGSIYVAHCLVSGKKYVGQTCKLVSRRWSEHVADALSGRSQNPLHRAIRKYGIEQFKVEIVRTCEVDVLDKAECEWIQKLGTMKPAGYNITLGGVGVRGLKHTKATKIRIAASVAKACAYRLDEMSETSKALWGDANYKAAQSAGFEAKRPIISKTAKMRWAVMDPQTRKAYMAKSAHTGAKWLKKPLVEQAVTRAKLAAIWASKSPEELAEIYARRGAGVRAAAERRRLAKACPI